MPAMDHRIPPIGSKIEVLTRSSFKWMNDYRRPTTGVVAKSNSWDPPGTFRLYPVAHHKWDSIINPENIVSLRILDEEAGSDVKLTANVVEVLGSKGDVYIVTLDGDKASCNCVAGGFGRHCKHVDKAKELQTTGP
jgi:hypothetical protein